MRWFTLDEFRCKCCGKAEMDNELLETLDAIRDELGLSMRVVSGFRCEDHNAAVGGSRNSFHLRGKAADIAAPSGTPYRDKLLTIAGRMGVGGVGLYADFVHLDVGPRRFWVKR